MPEQPEFQQRLQSIERLLAAIEGAGDPNLRATMRELVQTVMDLHGAGLDRMLELINASGDGGASIIQRLGRDELTGSLLILYNLHPLDLETRVTQGIEKARSRLRAYDSELEVLSIQDGDVRLRLLAHGRDIVNHGCGSTPQALKETVEAAIYQAAPDVSSLVIEGLPEQGANGKQGFVPLSMLQGTASNAA